MSNMLLNVFNFSISLTLSSLSQTEPRVAAVNFDAYRIYSGIARFSLR